VNFSGEQGTSKSSDSMTEQSGTACGWKGKESAERTETEPRIGATVPRLGIEMHGYTPPNLRFPFACMRPDNKT